MAHEIFISYSTRDDRIAEAVCQALEQSGIPCWIASRDIPPGTDWDELILSGIEECQMVLLLLSSQSNKSEHVKRELLFAVDCHKDIVSLRTEEVAPSRKLRYALGAHQWVDGFPPPLAQHLKKLASDLQLRLIKLKSKSPEVRVLSPSAGEVWQPGGSHEIRWEIHTASDRTVEKWKLSLVQGSRELQVLADSGAGSSLETTKFAWTVPPALPPGTDYKIRFDVTDDEGQPGSALVPFSVQAASASSAVPAVAPEAKEQSPPRQPDTTAAKEKPAAETPPSSAATPAKSSAISRLDELPFPTLPLGVRLILTCVMMYACFMGFAGGVREAFVSWNATKPAISGTPLGRTDFGPSLIPNPSRPGETIDLSPYFRGPLLPEEPSMGDKFDTWLRRSTACLESTATGFGVAALVGVGVGVVVGGLAWLVFVIAARVGRRPLEIVIDDWVGSFMIQVSWAVILAGLITLFGGLTVWPWAVGIGLAGGLILATVGRFLPDQNQQRQDAILKGGTSEAAK
jgi:hypothetical protein